MPSATARRTIVSFASMLGVLVATGLARGESPSTRSAAAQEAVVRAGGHILDEASRVKFGHADLYVPTFFRPVAGTYDLVVHFHGIPSLQEENFERAHLNAIVVSVNLGIASDAYSNAFRAPGSFDALLAADAARPRPDRTRARRHARPHRALGLERGLRLRGRHPQAAWRRRPRRRRAPRRRPPHDVRRPAPHLRAGHGEVGPLRRVGHARREALRTDALVDPDHRLPEHDRDDRRASARDLRRQGRRRTPSARAACAPSTRATAAPSTSRATRGRPRKTTSITSRG